jgi:hypothetical protein
LGLTNFVAYTLGYFLFIGGGEAMNGRVTATRAADGEILERHYYAGRGADEFEVSHAVWVYSAIHPTTLWISVGAVLLAMLTLAKDRIVISMQATRISGRAFITFLAVLITIFTVSMTIYFIHFMIQQLVNPRAIVA